MTTPLSLFKESPRWRIAVISAFIITATVILVQPDPQRRAATGQQPRQATKQSPPSVSSPAQTPSMPRVSSMNTQKKTPVSPSVRSIHPGTSPKKVRDINLPATRTIAPSGDSADEISTEAPEVTPIEEQNSLIPSG